ncbi:MAG TPA: hypothetical protein PLW86_16795 [Rhodocyclaceae bacterium]|nr:hypothetical protein [Rhodocyclaceae bacterium]
MLRIRIPAFRNLRDLDIAFESHLPPAAGASVDAVPKPIRSNALMSIEVRTRPLSARQAEIDQTHRHPRSQCSATTGDAGMGVFFAITLKEQHACC